MERPGRIIAALMAPLIPWLEALPGLAQVPAAVAPASAGPPTQAPTLGWQPIDPSQPPVPAAYNQPAPPPTPAPAPLKSAQPEPPPERPVMPAPRAPEPEKQMMPAPQGMPGGPNPDLQVPQPNATDRPLPINLAAALQLADARPLVVAAAQAGAWLAEAQLKRAQVLWLPQLNLGADYVRHDGYGPDFNRGINTAARPLNQNINFLYTGIGLIYPGTQSADMIFQPLAARQVLKSQRWNIQKSKNDAMLRTAQAYFDVHRYRGMYAGALDTVERAAKLVHRVEELSRDLVPGAEVDRTKRALADLEQQVASAREGWRIASADLTQVLRLDPRAVIAPTEPDQLQITLIDPAKSLDDLIPIGLTNRPELASQQNLVQAALVRIRQEKLRPLVPSFLLNGFQTPQELIQAGAMGIGSGSQMNWWSFRDDFSPQLLWQFDGLGLGNLARVKEQRAQQSLTIVELFRIQDAVAADVTRAQARIQSASVRVLQADRGLREAIITYNKNYEGLRQTTRFGNVLVQAYRPQEAVAAIENLKNSYDDYFGAVADYNRAQFEMFHALGYPARDVSAAQPPGTPMEVDPNRPGYLPPVRTGPPPATR